ncbi:hypothetical protein K9L63_03210 [Candidatus Gracilibacteria bacterium]|nr:hypothetical protein [Candidatus Gracilibacteria bacterium]
MKIFEALERILTSLNGASREPIFETYDKNVQGNTVWERGIVAASVVTPFRDMPELPEQKSCIGIAIGTGGSPLLAKISARTAAEHAVAEAVVKVSCVGGEPLALTDCLNFGNPEKPEQMGEFVEGIEGLKKACTEFNIPIVSGNVSLYNESGGRSIPPSALVSVFARVDRSGKVPLSSFQNAGETIFCVGSRSGHLGGSALFDIAGKRDSRTPEINFSSFKKWVKKLQQVAALNIISTATPIGYGGLLTAVTRACFEKKLGAEVKIQTTCHGEERSDEAISGISASSCVCKTPRNDRGGEGIISFLFSEDPGAIIATAYPEKVQEIFGEEAVKIGTVTHDFHLHVSHEREAILDKNLTQMHQKWDNQLREIL